MRLILRKKDHCWVELDGAEGKFLVAIKAGIRPSSYRKFDTESQKWCVHWHWLGWVVPLARKYFNTVDYSELPSLWQMRAAGACIPLDEAVMREVLEKNTESNPYEVLCIMPEAPIEIIQAAYKALAKKNHPDTGGSDESFRRIEEAYRKILKSRKLD